MRILEWLRAVREFMEFMTSPEVTWEHKPIKPDADLENSDDVIADDSRLGVAVSTTA